MVNKDVQRKLLIELRSKLIGKLNTLPYTIYTDDVIEKLLEAQPKSIAELEKVKGFPKGGKRVTGFGEAVVAVFTKTSSVESFELAFNNGKASVETKLKDVSSFDSFKKIK